MQSPARKLVQSPLPSRERWQVQSEVCLFALALWPKPLPAQSVPAALGATGSERRQEVSSSSRPSICWRSTPANANPSEISNGCHCVTHLVDKSCLAACRVYRLLPARRQGRHSCGQLYT